MNRIIANLLGLCAIMWFICKGLIIIGAIGLGLFMATLPDNRPHVQQQQQQQRR